MSKYRDRLQIIADILLIVSRRARKTQIMYQANLSYRLLCRYLEEVVNNGLVRYEDEERFVLTPKGQEFLHRHEEYSKHCKNLEEHINSVNSKKSVLEKLCGNASVPISGSSRYNKVKGTKK
jgi:predicted transcriptional regulator